MKHLRRICVVFVVATALLKSVCALDDPVNATTVSTTIPKAMDVTPNATSDTTIQKTNATIATTIQMTNATTPQDDEGKTTTQNPVIKDDTPNTASQDKKTVDPCRNKTTCKACFGDDMKNDCEFLIFTDAQTFCVGRNITVADRENLSNTSVPYKTFREKDHCRECNDATECHACFALDGECQFWSYTSGKTACMDKNAKPDESGKPQPQIWHHETSCYESLKQEQVTSKGGFDGASFFGGIILTLALPTIGFIGYKMYQRRRGNNRENYNIF